VPVDWHTPLPSYTSDAVYVFLSVGTDCFVYLSMFMSNCLTGRSSCGLGVYVNKRVSPSSYTSARGSALYGTTQSLLSRVSDGVDIRITSSR